MPRKGYASRAAIPAATLAALSRGTEEALTLSECLAVDFQTL
jgi:hypothetical protein